MSANYFIDLYKTEHKEYAITMFKELINKDDNLANTIFFQCSNEDDFEICQFIVSIRDIDDNEIIKALKNSFWRHTNIDFAIWLMDLLQDKTMIDKLHDSFNVCLKDCSLDINEENNKWIEWILEMYKPDVYYMKIDRKQKDFNMTTEIEAFNYYRRIMIDKKIKELEELEDEELENEKLEDEKLEEEAETQRIQSILKYILGGIISSSLVIASLTLLYN
jgi:hypothetical protein